MGVRRFPGAGHVSGLAATMMALLALTASMVGAGAAEAETAADAPSATVDELPETVEAVRAGDIPLGVTLPLTGPFESYGQSALAGILARVREQNVGGGVGGRRIAPVVRDNRSLSADALSDIDVFTRNPSHRVAAVVGPLIPGIGGELCALARERGVVVVRPLAGLGPDDDSVNWVFRIGMSAATQAHALARFQIQAYGAERAGILVDAHDESSWELADSFRKAFEAEGGVVAAVAVMAAAVNARPAGVASEKWPPPAPLAACLDALQAHRLDILYIPCRALTAIDIVEAIGQRPGLKSVRLCGSDLWDSQLVFDGTGERILGACFTSALFDVGINYAPYQHFLTAMRRAGIDMPDAQSACGYDAATLVINAFSAAGDDPGAVRAALASTYRVPLATGITSLKPNGDAIKPVMLRIMEVRDGWPTPVYAQADSEFSEPSHAAARRTPAAR